MSVCDIMGRYFSLVMGSFVVIALCAVISFFVFIYVEFLYSVEYNLLAKVVITLFAIYIIIVVLVMVFLDRD